MIDPSEWIFDFARKHMVRCQKPGWPKLPPGEPSDEAVHHFAPWVLAFRRAGVTQEAADLASQAMAGKEYPFPGGEHLNEFMKYIPAAFDQINAAKRGLAAGTREECAHRSRNCPECAGGGLTSRRMLRDGTESSAALYCLCPMGEWIASNHYAKNRDLFKRFRRLIQYPELWDRDLDHPSWPPTPEPRPWALEPFWIAGPRVFVPGPPELPYRIDPAGIGRRPD